MNARDRIYAELRRRLTGGHYAPDSTLVPQAVSEEFAVSRTPAREALGLLERDGLLVATHRGFLLRRCSDEEMLEIFEARSLLDAGAAEAAARRRSPLDLARLEELAERAHDGSDPAAVRKVLNQWHEAVRSAAHNGTLSALIQRLEAQITMQAPWRPTPAEHAFDSAIAHHDAVLAAIRDADPEAARTRMLAHLAEDRDVRIRQLVSRTDP